jgi:spore coat polysaccharide biosynthesis predicted glycosyltransferase SpsG
VLDHYRFADGYQKLLRDGGLRWMQFGNLMHDHALEGDLVHDASPGAKASDYAARFANPRIRFLAGPSYALVGEPFRAARAGISSVPQAEVRRVLLTFGGGDDHGATLSALDWLEAAGYRGETVILTTRMNLSLPAIRKRAAASPSVSLRVDDWNPAPQMAACQLAICAGGTSLHELACLAVPAVIACIAENQVAPARAWHDAGLGVLLGNIADIPAGEAIGTIGTLLNNHNTRREKSERCIACQDGAGASRTAAELLN